jgi:hypothetical protein
MVCIFNTGYKLVPVACIGTEEIFVHLYDIPAHYMYRLMNDNRANKPDQSIPACIPTWPRKTVITFCPKLDTSMYRMDELEHSAIAARDLMLIRVQNGIKQCLAFKTN